MNSRALLAAIVVMGAAIAWADEQDSEAKSDQLTKATFLIRGLH